MNLAGYKYRFPEKAKRYFVVFLSLLGHFFFLPTLLVNTLKGNKLNQEEITKILIARNDGIGDFVLSLPALRLLRETYQKAYIAIVAPSWQNELASASKLFDEIFIFDDA